jgi:hypothetical protein
MLRKLFSFFAILLFSFLAFSPAAFAQSSTPSIANQGNSFFCAPNSSNSNAQQAAGNLLPLDRWSGVANENYTYLPSGFFSEMGSLPKQLSADVGSLTLSGGNSLWGITSSLSQLSEGFCFSQGAAQSVNSITASIWSFLSQGYVLVLLLIIGLVIVLLRVRKGGRIADLLRVFIFVGLIGVIGIQSSKSVSAQSKAAGNYPVASPAWLIDTLFNTVGAVVNAPVRALASSFGTQYTTLSTSSAKPGPLSCAAYQNQLIKEYQSSYGTSPAAQTQAIVPEMISNIWSQSGLLIDEAAQFGNTPYTSNVYCRLYEEEAGISPINQARITAAAAGGSLPSPLRANSSAFTGPGQSAQTVNEDLVGWAACTNPKNSTIAPYGEWAGKATTTGTGTGGTKTPDPTGRVSGLNPNAPGSVGTSTSSSTNFTVASGDCQTWATTSGQLGGTSLDLGNSGGAISQSTSTAPNQQSFLLTLDGDNAGQSFVPSVAYVISSVVMLVVFGILDLAVVIAKFGILIMLALLLFFLVADVIPTSRKGHSVKFAKQFVGFVLLAIGAEAILGLVALLTSILDKFGASVLGSGTIGMIWVAITPIAAVIGLHKLFKTFKVPSPFRPDSAMAYAGMIGGGGFLSGDMIGRMHNRAMGRGKGAGKGALSSVRNKLTGAPGRQFAPRGSGGATGPNGRPKVTTQSGMPFRTVNRNKGAATGTAGAAPTGTGSGGPTNTGGPTGTGSGGTTGTGGQTGAGTTGTTAMPVGTAPEPTPTETKEQQKYRHPRDMRLEGAQKKVQARRDRRAAKRYAKMENGATVAQRAKNRIKSSAQMGVARAKANPVGVLKKAAVYGVVAAASPFSLPATALALGGIYGYKKIRQAARERPYAKAERQASVDYLQRAHRSGKIDRVHPNDRRAQKRQQKAENKKKT